MFLDTPGPGTYVYAVTAVSTDGWESPQSHCATAICGADAPAPRVTACKPFTRLRAGDSLPLRVVALSDRDIARVTLFTRHAGDELWTALPMAHRFRHSYQALLPTTMPGTIEYFVAAEDTEGRTTTWPETGAALPWSATVV
jgi:hypothetical protein